MDDKITQDYERIMNILNSSLSSKEKYFKIKSLERNLLEYILFKDNIIIPTSYRLSNAAEFISSYFLIQNVWDQFDYYQELAESTLFTLKRILHSNEKNLKDISDFKMYERYFHNFKKVLIAM